MPSPNMLLPGRGATLMPSRTSQEQSKYVYRAYPSTRYHPDGRVVIVQHAADEAERCPEAGGWAKTAFPAKPAEPAKPEMSVEQLTSALVAAQAELVANRYMFDKSWDGLTRERDQLKASVDEFAAKNAELHAEIAQLRAQTAAPAAEGAIAGGAAPMEEDATVPNKKRGK